MAKQKADASANDEAQSEKQTEDVVGLDVKDSTADSEERERINASADQDPQTDMPEPAVQDESEAAPKKPKSTHSKKKKVWFISGIVAVLLAVLFAVPVTRYAILGTFISKDITFTITDSKTNKPVSGVQVSLAGKTVSSDAQGKVTVKGVPVGDKSVTAKKKYYQDLTTNVLVPLTTQKEYRLSVVATGRQVPITVINKISGKPVAKAVITADGTSSTTDDKGETIVVLPANKSAQDATISVDNYNKTKITIQITEQKDDKNTFSITPSGKVYFLSKRTGKIDVMKSNLDGSNVETVVAGTGKEDDRDTVLLASRDWRYLALKARRDSDQPKLYVIDTNSGKLSIIDEGDATFIPVGWYNHYFIFSVDRNSYKDWQPKKQVLKSFNAGAYNLTVLDESDASGDSTSKYARESILFPYILDNEIVYAKSWSVSGSSDQFNGRDVTLDSIKPDGSSKKVLKSYSANYGTYAGGLRLYKPQELYVYLSVNTQDMFWEYEDGNLTEKKELKTEDFYQGYPTYLLSPSGKSSFWSESRDGKNALFVGNDEGNDGKEIASLSEYTPYGWLGEDYVLVSKAGSELYVLSRTSPSDKPLKITDYHKPQSSFGGYGYGYGGL